MNIDELADSISEEELRLNLIKCINVWKSDDRDINDLYNMIAKWHGNVWFKSESESNKFYKNIQFFKTQAIDGIGGLTVNERLFFFDLLNEWENTDKSGQIRIRGKIHAFAKQEKTKRHAKALAL